MKQEKRYLLTYSDNYADEFNLDGELTISQEDKDLFEKSIEFIKQEDIEFSFYFGSNQEQIVEDLECVYCIGEYNNTENIDSGFASSFFDSVIYTYEDTPKLTDNDKLKKVLESDIYKELVKVLREQEIIFEFKPRKYYVAFDFINDTIPIRIVKNYIFIGDKEVYGNRKKQEILWMLKYKGIKLKPSTSPDIGSWKALEAEKYRASWIGLETLIHVLGNSFDRAIKDCDYYNYEKQPIIDGWEEIQKILKKIENDRNSEKEEKERLNTSKSVEVLNEWNIETMRGFILSLGLSSERLKEYLGGN